MRCSSILAASSATPSPRVASVRRIGQIFVDLGFITEDGSTGMALFFQTHEEDWAASQELFACRIRTKVRWDMSPVCRDTGRWLW